MTTPTPPIDPVDQLIALVRQRLPKSVQIDDLVVQTGQNREDVLDQLSELAGRGIIKWQKHWND